MAHAPIAIPNFGAYVVHATAAGFNDVTKQYDLSASTGRITVRFDQLSAMTLEIVVSANVSDIELKSPDPSQMIMVREELLDANPGRPGAVPHQDSAHHVRA